VDPLNASIAVVVPTRDRIDLLDACLASLRASVRATDEIIVADSASNDPRVREIAERHGAAYVRCDEPGASRARNAGWRLSRADVVAFIDDDVRVDEGWASALANAFSDPGTAFVTGRVGEPDGSTDPKLAQKVDAEPALLDRTTTGVIGHSANLAVRRRALETIGGFDEALGAGARFRAAEDLDLFDRLFAAGYVGRYDPAVSAVHESWRRLRDYVRLQGDYGYGIGARIAKLIRYDRSRAMAALIEAFGASGSVPLFRALRDRRLVGVAARSRRIVMTAGGFVVAMFTPVRDGHFR